MEEHKKKSYLILECTKCKRYLLAISSNKTRVCPYCEKRVTVDNAKVIGRLPSAEEARLALQKLKMHSQD